MTPVMAVDVGTSFLRSGHVTNTCKRLQVKLLAEFLLCDGGKSEESKYFKCGLSFFVCSNHNNIISSARFVEYARLRFDFLYN